MNIHKKGLEPIADVKSRILILGSFPGNASLVAREYYANPRNHFWQILSCIYNEPIGVEYKSRLDFLSRHGIALWDVLQTAERCGSLDSNIRLRSSTINDIESLIKQHPRIRAIGLNGTKAWKIFHQHWLGTKQNSILSSDHIYTCRLPSSSPTPGKNVKSFKQKVQDWQIFVEPAI